MISPLHKWNCVILQFRVNLQNYEMASMTKFYDYPTSKQEKTSDIAVLLYSFFFFFFC